MDKPRLKVRIHDGRYATAFSKRIASLLDDEPGIAAGFAPVKKKPGEKSALIAFLPPDDEEISHYDWIHVAGAGIDKIARALGPGEPKPVMTRTIGTMGAQMGEYVLAYVLEDFQRMEERQRAQAEKKWDQALEARRYLFDTEAAILGVGEIGQRIAAGLVPLARAVVGHASQSRPVDPFTEVRALGARGGLGSAGVVIAALPNTPGTRGIISGQIFSTMRNALFINVGRGEPVDEDALLKALDQGHVRRAVLDVFQEEPPHKDHWVWNDDRVTVTSHLSGITRPDDTAAAFLKAYREADGALPASTVDPVRGY